MCVEQKFASLKVDVQAPSFDLWVPSSMGKVSLSPLNDSLCATNGTDLQQKSCLYVIEVSAKEMKKR